MVFELDAKNVVKAVKSIDFDDTEFGTIIVNCRLILAQESSFLVCFARRQANVVAHEIDRASNSYASLTVSVDHP